MLAKKARGRIVNMHEAKTHLSELVEAAQRGEQISIARNGKPAAMLVPIASDRPRPPPGAYRNAVRMSKDFDEPLDDDFSGIPR
jgi:prevent-host-death family protein